PRRSNARSSSGIRQKTASCLSALPSAPEPFGLLVLAAPRKRNARIMKKTRGAKETPETEPDMLPEYRFDYGKARPNRFASRLKQGSRAVVLDPDVAAVFSTTDSVNAVLRALIQTMPR